MKKHDWIKVVCWTLFGIWLGWISICYTFRWWGPLVLYLLGGDSLFPNNAKPE